MKTVVLMGKGELAVKIAQWFHDAPDWRIAEVIPVIPEPDWTDSLAAWARLNCIPLVESGQFVDATTQGAYLCLSVYYDKILPAWFLSQFRHALNLHNAPLPKYRGVRPINWALKNGEEYHGVTIHRMTPNIDNGPIYAQARFRIDAAHDEVRDVYGQCLVHGWELFLDLMAIDLDALMPVPQNEAEATYYTAHDSMFLNERMGWERPAPLDNEWTASYG